jgi:hypothetical protein
MLHINEEQLSLYMSLFRGRNDVHARRGNDATAGQSSYKKLLEFVKSSTENV